MPTDPQFANLCRRTRADLLGERAAVVCGDALATMRRLPDGCVDLCFADPPYFLSNGGTTNRAGKRVAVDKGDWDRSGGLIRDHGFHTAWLGEVQRVLKPSGTVWVSGTQHAIFSIGVAVQALGFHLLNTVAWCKPNPPPNLARRTFTHANELLIWAAPARGDKLLHHYDYEDMKSATGKPMLDWWVMATAPAAERKYGKHPTQKPEGLLDRILLASSRPGDLVLDPFMGSGTTGVMAACLGRRFIGIELDARYARIASRRITAHIT